MRLRHRSVTPGRHTARLVDRLVHRATIFELNVDSYRRRTHVLIEIAFDLFALAYKRGCGRPATLATPNNSTAAEPPDS